ncbi:uncharacterized protein LOC131324794 isoform X1 [Rhododendron vialii]|uniref:uncharacterized protein LOC131324794 isoform X1 n=1 Tax=Rhododendron vialii TaxID=182163 RepID=UPI00265DC492|nr:uncharacterized protein LOC131324794 isoform X1 [Rhododendron vialii]XP_058212895.1 uncharacterized protein LOC131324794 isoform X1 [Rhododendron vialii]
MDGKKQMGSSSSFTTDLFGSTESSASSSSGIFGSIFAPSSKVFGRESLRSEAVGMKQDSANQKRSLGAVEENIRMYLTRTQILTIKNKEYNRVTSAHQYIMGVKTSILIRRKLSPLGTQRSIMKGEKMIWALLQEEIGGKGLYITKSQPPLACEFTLHYT